MIRKILPLFCLLGALTTARAQETWSLRRCIDYAIANNIEIRQQALSVEDAEINLSTSRNSRLPNLSASASQNLNFGRMLSQGSGEYVTANSASSTNFSVNTSVPVFAGMKIGHQIRTDQLNLKAATENLNKAKENIELQVTSFYLEVLFKKEIAEVYRLQAELTQKQVERTEALLEAGKVPRSQLFDIKAQLAKDELNLTNARNEYDLSLLTLTQSLNLPSAQGFAVAEPSSEDVVARNQTSVRPPEEIYAVAVGIKPHIKEAEYRFQSSRQSLKISQSAFWPTVTLGASYGSGFNQLLGSEFTNPSVGTQWRDNQREAVGLSLSVPLFNRLQTRNQVRQARLNIQNRELELDNAKLVLYKEIQQAYQSAVAARSKYTSTESAQRAASEAFVYAQERYDVGLMNVYEYSDAQTKLLTSRSEQLQAKYDFLFRAKILDFYRGIPIDIE